MNTFCKYGFPAGVWEQLKPTIQENEQYVNCAVHEIGNICIEQDAEGNCTKTDPLYAVDILWYSEIPDSFSTYEVFPDPIGVHTFSGCEELYTQRFCDFNPESPYCVVNETA